ncbi:MAG: peptidoglycan editing factor PgeF [bacterium]
MFRLENFMGKRILTSSFLDGEAVRAFFTTRDLPLKSGEREDLIKDVENNKKLLCEGFNIPLNNLIIPIQTHSDNVKIVNGKRETLNGNEQNLSSFASHLSPLENTDALVTNEKNLALALNFADCVPIIFFDPVKKVTAIAHAGWRGTVAKIAPKTVEKMVKNFSSKPKDIIALIGPAIGKCCFEVQDDVKTKLLDTIEKPYQEQVCNANRIDLKLINKLQLLANGVEKIDLCEYCTFCQSELFFSYRRENGKTARHSAVVTISKR